MPLVSRRRPARPCGVAAVDKLSGRGGVRRSSSCAPCRSDPRYLPAFDPHPFAARRAARAAVPLPIAPGAVEPGELLCRVAPFRITLISGPRIKSTSVTGSGRAASARPNAPLPLAMGAADLCSRALTTACLRPGELDAGTSHLHAAVVIAVFPTRSPSIVKVSRSGGRSSAVLPEEPGRHAERIAGTTTPGEQTPAPDACLGLALRSRRSRHSIERAERSCQHHHRCEV